MQDCDAAGAFVTLVLSTNNCSETYPSFCPQFGQKFAPSFFVPQFGQKFGFLPSEDGADGAELGADWLSLDGF